MSAISREAEAAHAPSKPEGKSRGWRRFAGPLIGVVGVALAAFLLHRTFREYTWAEFTSALATAPHMRLVAALGFAAASYLCLTFFDWLATRYAGFPMPWRRAAHASFTALSLGHNIGFAALSSGAVRYRFTPDGAWTAKGLRK